MDAAILIRDLEPFRQARSVWDRTRPAPNSTGRFGQGEKDACPQPSPRDVGMDLAEIPDRGD
jgi:hypothetical protein